MGRAVRLQVWLRVVMAALAMMLLFASAQSHSSPLPCSATSHVGANSDLSLHGSADTDTDMAYDDCCGSVCTVCIPPVAVITLVQDSLERGTVVIAPTARLYGLAPGPGRHPPRTAA